MSELAYQNLRRAFEASAQGRPVVLAEDVRLEAAPRILESLAWLDVAVCVEMWRRLGLDALVREHTARRRGEVPTESIIAALVMQRCIAPGSKLSIQQWFPRTALPEMLDVPLARFNNARVHRALEDLEAGGVALQAGSAPSLAAREDGLRAAFLDVTDTWFVGRGPTTAEKRLTKEGLWRRKVGIVLLCDQKGYPLRWKVIPGRRADSKAMREMARDVGGVHWLSGVPVACDRAMGTPKVLRQLTAAGIRFVTMLTQTGFPALAGESLPIHVTDGLDAEAKDAEALADSAAEKAGMVRVRDRLRGLDLGVREVPRPPPPKRKNPPSHVARLGQAVDARAAFERGEPKKRVAERMGISRKGLDRVALLADLCGEARAAVEDGRLDGLSFEALCRIAVRPPDAQREVLAHELQALAARRIEADEEEEEEPEDGAPLRVRVVVIFNPAAFVRQRTGAKAMCERLDAAIARLNATLASPRSTRDEDQARLAANRILSDFDASDTFDVTVQNRPGTHKERLVVTLVRREEHWSHRRALDGFSVLVAHPDLKQSPTELSELYGAKQWIEDDFHIIKSIVDVRPVFHREDAKVDAHVTVCMLALLLHRHIQHKLGGGTTAAAALENLAGTSIVRLRCGPQAPPVYQVATISDAQRATLERLNCQRLLNQESLTELLAYTRP